MLKYHKKVLIASYILILKLHILYIYSKFNILYNIYIYIMAVYCPPSYTEKLTVFNNAYYKNDCPLITPAYLTAHYLQYPTGQGNETIPNLHMSGSQIVYDNPNASNGTTQYNIDGFFADSDHSLPIIFETNLNATGLSLREHNIGQEVKISYDRFDITGDTIPFRFQMANSFFRQMNPTSWRVKNTQDNGYWIEKFDAFVVGENIGDLRLREPENYLDEFLEAGWSVILSNATGGDINVSGEPSPTYGATVFYAHSSGLGGGNIALKKWATCRFTLTFLPFSLNTYAWAVSQF